MHLTRQFKLYGFLIFLMAANSAAAADYDPFLGSWDLVKMTCLDHHPTQEVKIQFPFSDYSPRPQLHIEAKTDPTTGTVKIFANKTVTKNSCEGANASQLSQLPTELFRAGYEVEFQNIQFTPSQTGPVAAPFFTAKMVSKGLVSLDRIKMRQMITCDLFAGLTFFLLPRYLKKEASREYTVAVKGEFFYLYFEDPALCKSGSTAMLFRKL